MLNDNFSKISRYYAGHTFPTTFGTSAKTHYDKLALASVRWLANVISDDTVAILGHQNACITSREKKIWLNKLLMATSRSRCLNKPTEGKKEMQQSIAFSKHVSFMHILNILHNYSCNQLFSITKRLKRNHFSIAEGLFELKNKECKVILL